MSSVEAFLSQPRRVGNRAHGGSWSRSCYHEFGSILHSLDSAEAVQEALYALIDAYSSSSHESDATDLYPGADATSHYNDEAMSNDSNNYNDKEDEDVCASTVVLASDPVAVMRCIVLFIEYACRTAAHRHCTAQQSPDSLMYTLPTHHTSLLLHPRDSKCATYGTHHASDDLLNRAEDDNDEEQLRRRDTQTCRHWRLALDDLLSLTLLFNELATVRSATQFELLCVCARCLVQLCLPRLYPRSTNKLTSHTAHKGTAAVCAQETSNEHRGHSGCDDGVVEEDESVLTRESVQSELSTLLGMIARRLVTQADLAYAAPSSSNGLKNNHAVPTQAAFLLCPSRVQHDEGEHRLGCRLAALHALFASVWCVLHCLAQTCGTTRGGTCSSSSDGTDRDRCSGRTTAATNVLEQMATDWMDHLLAPVYAAAPATAAATVSSGSAGSTAAAGTVTSPFLLAQLLRLVEYTMWLCAHLCATAHDSSSRGGPTRAPCTESALDDGNNTDDNNTNDYDDNKSKSDCSDVADNTESVSGSQREQPVLRVCVRLVTGLLTTVQNYLTWQQHQTTNDTINRASSSHDNPDAPYRAEDNVRRGSGRREQSHVFRAYSVQYALQRALSVIVLMDGTRNNNNVIAGSSSSSENSNNNVYAFDRNRPENPSSGPTSNSQSRMASALHCQRVCQAMPTLPLELRRGATSALMVWGGALRLANPLHRLYTTQRHKQLPSSACATSTPISTSCVQSILRHCTALLSPATALLSSSSANHTDDANANADEGENENDRGAGGTAHLLDSDANKLHLPGVGVLSVYKLVEMVMSSVAALPHHAQQMHSSSYDTDYPSYHPPPQEQEQQQQHVANLHAPHSPARYGAFDIAAAHMHGLHAMQYDAAMRAQRRELARLRLIEQRGVEAIPASHLLAHVREASALRQRGSQVMKAASARARLTRAAFSSILRSYDKLQSGGVVAVGGASHRSSSTVAAAPAAVTSASAPGSPAASDLRGSVAVTQAMTTEATLRHAQALIARSWLQLSGRLADAAMDELMLPLQRELARERAVREQRAKRDTTRSNPAALAGGQQGETRSGGGEAYPCGSQVEDDWVSPVSEVGSYYALMMQVLFMLYAAQAPAPHGCAHLYESAPVHAQRQANDTAHATPGRTHGDASSARHNRSSAANDAGEVGSADALSSSITQTETDGTEMLQLLRSAPNTIITAQGATALWSDSPSPANSSLRVTAANRRDDGSGDNVSGNNEVGVDFANDTATTPCAYSHLLCRLLELVESAKLTTLLLDVLLQAPALTRYVWSYLYRHFCLARDKARCVVGLWLLTHVALSRPASRATALNMLLQLCLCENTYARRLAIRQIGSLLVHSPLGDAQTAAETSRPAGSDAANNNNSNLSPTANSTTNSSSSSSSNSAVPIATTSSTLGMHARPVISAAAEATLTRYAMSQLTTVPMYHLSQVATRVYARQLLRALIDPTPVGSGELPRDHPLSHTQSGNAQQETNVSARHSSHTSQDDEDNNGNSADGKDTVNKDDWTAVSANEAALLQREMNRLQDALGRHLGLPLLLCARQPSRQLAALLDVYQRCLHAGNRAMAELMRTHHDVTRMMTHVMQAGAHTRNSAFSQMLLPLMRRYSMAAPLLVQAMLTAMGSALRSGMNSDSNCNGRSNSSASVAVATVAVVLAHARKMYDMSVIPLDAHGAAALHVDGSSSGNTDNGAANTNAKAEEGSATMDTLATYHSSDISMYNTCSHNSSNDEGKDRNRSALGAVHATEKIIKHDTDAGPTRAAERVGNSTDVHTAPVLHDIRFMAPFLSLLPASELRSRYLIAFLYFVQVQLQFYRQLKMRTQELRRRRQRRRMRTSARLHKRVRTEAPHSRDNNDNGGSDVEDDEDDDESSSEEDDDADDAMHATLSLLLSKHSHNNIVSPEDLHRFIRRVVYETVVKSPIAFGDGAARGMSRVDFLVYLHRAPHESAAQPHFASAHSAAAASALLPVPLHPVANASHMPTADHSSHYDGSNGNGGGHSYPISQLAQGNTISSSALFPPPPQSMPIHSSLSATHPYTAAASLAAREATAMSTTAGAQSANSASALHSTYSSYSSSSLLPRIGALTAREVIRVCLELPRNFHDGPAAANEERLYGVEEVQKAVRIILSALPAAIPAHLMWTLLLAAELLPRSYGSDFVRFVVVEVLTALERVGAWQSQPQLWKGVLLFVERYYRECSAFVMSLPDQVLTQALRAQPRLAEYFQAEHGSNASFRHILTNL